MKTESVAAIAAEPANQAAQTPPGQADWPAVGRRLRRYRKGVLGLSAAALGERAGMSQQWVSAIERGEVEGVSVAAVLKLAQACGRPMDWLLFGPDPDDVPDWLEPDLVELLKMLGPERRRALAEVLRRNPNWPDAGELPGTVGVEAA